MLSSFRTAIVTPLLNIRHRWKDSVERWIEKRQPEHHQIELTQRNLYILPTASSAGFLLTMLMLWMLGTNYENNLALLLSFLLLSIFVTSIHLTHGNMNRLKMRAFTKDAVFSGEKIAIGIQLVNVKKREKYAVHINDDQQVLTVVDIPAQSSTDVEIEFVTQQRGFFKIPRLTVVSTFPIGLFRCWSQPKLSTHALVYPKPIAAPVSSYDSGNNVGDAMSSQAGIDDFAGLEPWRPGEPMQRIAWKQYSAGRGMLSKQFESTASDPQWLSWDMFGNLDVEARLSAICERALAMEARQTQYGLRIPSCELAPANGERHLHALLTALALYPEAPEGVS